MTVQWPWKGMVLLRISHLVIMLNEMNVEHSHQTRFMDGRFKFLIKISLDFENVPSKTRNKSNDFPLLLLEDLVLADFWRAPSASFKKLSIIIAWRHNNKMNRRVNDSVFHWFCNYIRVVDVGNIIQTLCQAPFKVKRFARVCRIALNLKWNESETTIRLTFITRL